MTRIEFDCFEAITRALKIVSRRLDVLETSVFGSTTSVPQTETVNWDALIEQIRQLRNLRNVYGGTAKAAYHQACDDILRTIERIRAQDTQTQPGKPERS